MKRRIFAAAIFLCLALALLPWAQAAGESYVALGDSITTGYGLNEGETGFAQQIADSQGYDLQNLAAGGATSAELLASLSEENVSAAIAGADVITITIGGNDLMNALYEYLASEYNTENPDANITPEDVASSLAGNNPALSQTTMLLFAAGVIEDFFPTLAAATGALDDFEANFTKIINTIKTANPNAKLIVANQYNPYSHLEDTGMFGGYVKKVVDAVDMAVQALNGVIESSSNGYIVADVYTAFENSEDNPCNASVSMMSVNLDFHPNATGHGLIAGTITNILANPTIYVGGVALTGSVDSPTYALTSGGTVTTVGANENNYNIKWDGSTLTLKGANISGGYKFDDNWDVWSAAIYYEGAGLELVLAGNSAVTGPNTSDGEDDFYDSYGIYAPDAALTVSGTGSLTVSGGDTGSNAYSCGICAESVTVSSGSVTAKGGADTGINTYSYGIYANDDIAITGGTVTANGGQAYYDSCGIYANGNIAISGGSVEATGGNAGDSYGIYSDSGSVTISGNALSVTAKGGAATAISYGIYAASYGIYAEDSVAISAGAVEATGGEADYDSYGIYAVNNVTISGNAGKVTAKGDQADDESSGIRTSNGNITISGGTVKAQGGEADYDSYGIYANGDGDITISGGTVKAQGGEADSGSFGIYAYDGNIAITGGDVTATGGDITTSTLDQQESYGICAENGGVTISGKAASITATGGSAEDSYGIFAMNNVTISGGSVEATGSQSSYRSGGIYSAGESKVTITGGDVTATGEDITTSTLDQQESYGIRAGGVDISGGTVKATGGDITATGTYEGGECYLYSCGISAGGLYSGLEISGGTVTATGGAITYSSGLTDVVTNSYGLSSWLHISVSGGEVETQGDDGAMDSDQCTIAAAPGAQIQALAKVNRTDEDTITLTSYDYLEAYEYLKITVTATNANIFVGGQGLTGSTENPAYALTSNGSVTTEGASAGNYNIKWDGSTLTLNNANITQGSYEGAAIFAWNGDMEIVLIGDSTVTGPDSGTEDSYGIYVFNYDYENSDGDMPAHVTVSGSGSLEVTGGAGSAEYDSYGIYADNLTVSSGNLEVSGGAGEDSYGIDTFNLTVSGGGLEVSGGAAEDSYGIYAYNLTVSSGSLTATGGTGEDSYGINTNNLTVSGGTVNTSGGAGTGYSCGIDAIEVSVSGGALTANGSDSGGNSDGIWTDILTVTGGTITATGGRAEGVSAGIDALNFEISGGTITATGDDRGIYTEDEVDDYYEITVSPASGQQIQVLQGESAADATAIEGSPFSSQTDITASLSANARYFRSEVAGGSEPDPIVPGTGGPISYPPAIENTDDGSVTVSQPNPSQGDTVTLTPEPEEGHTVGEITVTDQNGNQVEVTENADGTWSFTQPAGQVTISVTFVCDGQTEHCPAHIYIDVDTASWYHLAVDYAIEKGLMNGVGDNLFDPHGTATRAQIVTILWRLEGEPVVNYLMDFEDVQEGSWYAEAVRWAASQGIVDGYDNGGFGPADPVTREQLAAILYRYAVHKGYDVSIGEDTNILSYADAMEISEYAIPALQWACGAGIVNGMDGNTLVPQGEAARAQIAAMLMRFEEGRR